jgi:hypothetical protein
VTSANVGGQWKGKVRIADDFDELPEDIARAFGMDHASSLSREPGERCVLVDLETSTSRDSTPRPFVERSAISRLHQRLT